MRQNVNLYCHVMFSDCVLSDSCQGLAYGELQREGYSSLHAGRKGEGLPEVECGVLILTPPWSLSLHRSPDECIIVLYQVTHHSAWKGS